MFTHKQIWSALDRLAERNGYSVSGLAKASGLDPTTFNKSKRTTVDGRKRWPSSESLAKVLTATGTTSGSFVKLLVEQGAPPEPQRPMPLMPLTKLSEIGVFSEEGYPAGDDWDELDFPEIDDPHAFAFEIDDADDHAPFYRDGDVMVVSPGAVVRRGDRVVARIKDGSVLACTLRRRTNRTIDFGPLGPEGDIKTFDTLDIVWMSRILWASQ